MGDFWCAHIPGERAAMQRSHSAVSAAIASLSLGRLSDVHARCSLVSECRRRDSNCSATILSPQPCSSNRLGLRQPSEILSPDAGPEDWSAPASCVDDVPSRPL